MTTIVTRLYAKAETAEATAAALRKRGFAKSAVAVVGAGATEEATLAAINALGVYAAGAKTYAGLVQGGKTLVVAHAPFGKSFIAAEIMDAHDPVEAPVKYDAVYVPAQDPPSRYRERKDLPIIFNSDTLVFSDGLFPPAVIRNHRPFNSVMTGNSPKAGLVSGTISEKFGLPLLSGRRPRGGIMQGTITDSMGVPTISRR